SIEQMRNWLRLHICFDDRYSQDDGYEAGFNGFWRMVNLLQFLPDMTFTSRKAVNLPQESGAAKIETSVVAEIQSDESWAEILEFGLLSAEEVALLQSLSLPAPTVGYELQDDDGEIIAEADLAWPLQKQALIIDNQDFTALFENKGWHVAFGPIDENTLQHLSGGDK
ncbi:helicase, partial [Enterobacter roggenkampii]